MRAAVNPEPLTQVLAIRSRQVTTPEALTAPTKATVRSYSTPNPNGAKLYAAGIRRRHSKQPRRRALPSALAGLLSVTVELHPPSACFGWNFWATSLVQTDNTAAPMGMPEETPEHRPRPPSGRPWR